MPLLTFRSERTKRRVDRHRDKWSSCDACGLGSVCRNHVFVRGQIPADVCFIGEAPGEDEDREGYPFVGRAGTVLDNLIFNTDVCSGYRYCIINALACIPYKIPEDQEGFRKPTKKELKACLPRFRETIETTRANHFVLLGESAKAAFKLLDYSDETYEDRVLEIRHPSFILRNGGVGSLEYKRNYLKLKRFLFEKLGGEGYA